MQFDYLINIFHQQQYGQFNKSVSVEDILQRYALFPNEAIYLVDYQKAQLETLTPNFSKITGIDSPHKNDVAVLYEHVDKHSMTPFLSYTKQLLKYGFVNSEKRFEEERDFNLNLYKTVHNRIILKSTSILHYDSNNKIRYSVGKLMDVTGLVPYQQFGFKFTGPGSAKIYAAFQGLTNFEKILTARELEVLAHTGAGLNANQMAKLLNVSNHTIDTHKRNIIRKLEASNSIDAYNKAKSMGLFL